MWGGMGGRTQCPMEGTATVLCWCSLVSPWLVSHCISVIRLKSAGKPLLTQDFSKFPELKLLLVGWKVQRTLGFPLGSFIPQEVAHTLLFSLLWTWNAVSFCELQFLNKIKTMQNAKCGLCLRC